MSVVKVKQPGNAIPRVDKRELESIVYTLDLSELINHPTEMVNGIEQVSSGLALTDVKPQQGKNILVRVPPCALDSSTQYKDYRTDILFKTSQDNIRSAVFTIRVYK